MLLFDAKLEIGELLAFRVRFLVRHQVALEGEFKAAPALDGLAAQLLVVPHVHLDVEPLAALAAPERLLALAVLAAVVTSKLVQTHERFAAFGTARWNLLVRRLPAPRPGVVHRAQCRELHPFHGASVRVVRLVVHLHRLWVLECLVAPRQPALERSAILYQVHRHLLRLDALVGVLDLLQSLLIPPLIINNLLTLQLKNLPTNCIRPQGSLLQ